MKFRSSDIFAPVNVILIIVNLIVFNLVASNFFGRLDLTENRTFTLSNVTREIIRELEEPLTIKAFFTRDVPYPYNNVARDVKDQLAEMKAHGKGNFRYEFLDPTDEEDLKKEAESFRIEPMQVNEIKADKVEFKLVYMGMVLIYEDRQEVIPTIRSLGTLEYEIVSKIKRITASETQTVGFLEGHEESKLREDMTVLDRELRKLYDLKPVDLSMRNNIPDDIDVLCIIGPKQDIPEKDRFAIDQFIMRGGKLLMAVNKVDADLGQGKADRSPLRIDAWTENYGFRIKDELVMDLNSPTLPFQTMTRYGRNITLAQYTLFPQLINFNRELAALKTLRQVLLCYPNTIDTTAAADKDSIEIEPLFWTSERSAFQTTPYDINPMTMHGKYSYDMAHLPLGVLVKGKFTSYWKDKTIPVDDDGNPISEEDIIPESPFTRIVVIGDANFILDQYLPVVPGADNLTMMLNMIDWMAQDERLITIRSREVSSRPLKQIEDDTRRTIKILNLLIPPLLIIAFGLFRWNIRKSARKMALKDFNIKGPGGSR